jgi:tetratricopeptide (TPR) repeat protein
VRTAVLALASALLGSAALADPPPADSPAALVERGYDHFYNLEFDESIADFERAIALDPSVPDYHNHLAHAIVFQEMYRNGALESELVSGSNSFLRRAKMNPSPATEKRFLDEVGKSMQLCEARLAKNPNDMAALYAEGIAYGLRSDYYWVVKKSWRDSLSDATAARRLHNRITQLDPSNVDARMVEGLHDYIVGSLPWHWRMFGFLVGIHGDKERGIHTVQDVARNGKDNKLDATIFLCALYRRENRPKMAVPLIQELIRRFPRNYILRLELAEMYSMSNDKDDALSTLAQVRDLKTRHAPGYDRLPWDKIFFQEGSIQFWYRDFDQALDNLTKVTAHASEVDLNTGAYAYLRIGQIYDMTHRRQQALDSYRKAIAYAPEADASQEAKKYLSAPYHR